MTVHVLFFSLLRDLADTERLELDFPEGELCTVQDLLVHLYERIPGLDAWDDKLLIAVDLEYATRDYRLENGNEVALMPPVQGG